MCGIAGYIGKKDSLKVVVNGLYRLEYRGYDSAGVAFVENGSVKVVKTAGRITDLHKKLEPILEADAREGKVNTTIGHTRWATHGGITDENAHPHTDCHSKFAIVHNGIIENYRYLKDKLISQGHKFTTETDSEVIAHLLEKYYDRYGNIKDAVFKTISKLEGTYGLAIISSYEPDLLIGARNGSPLVLGIGDGEFILASDVNAIAEHTKSVIYLADKEVVFISPDNYEIRDIRREIVEKKIYEVDWDIEAIDKQGYSTFMEKEIHEQPETLENAIRGRLLLEEGSVKFGALNVDDEFLRRLERIVIVACGTSWHAGLVGEYLIEEFARIPVEVEYGSEFRYRNPILTEGDLVIAISQSGETADTLEAVREAKRKGAKVIGITNVVGSTIARETDGGIYIHAGPEIGVASTKAFTGQLMGLLLFTLYVSRLRTMGILQGKEFARNLQMIPEEVRKTIEKNEEHIKDIAKQYVESRNFLYLGRGYHFPVALEGALKLKEISYIHAEGYPAAEMKHGPSALIDENMPVVVIATRHPLYDKVLGNIEEVKARGGKVIAVVNEGDEQASKLADHTIEIPFVPEYVSPIVAVVPLQLLAYHIATLKGLDVDKPRNLAKSVTVE